MTAPDLFYNLCARAERAIAGRPLTQVIERTRAIVGPPLPDLEGDAQEGLTALKCGRRPTAAQVEALQAIVRSMRPSVLSKKGIPDKLPEDSRPVFPDWDEFCQRIKPYLYTIGRIDRKLPNGNTEPCGTGFLLNPELLLTNHHVVTQLTNGTEVIEPCGTEVRFGMEYMSTPDRPAISILELVSFHEQEDAAILRLKKTPALAQCRPLPWVETAFDDSHQVVVLGYPLRDTERNPLYVDQIFGGNFGVKRLAPGETIRTRAGALFHDCSTLGGNSGSPIVDLTTGAVVGLHRDGLFVTRNEAVGSDVLREFVARAIGSIPIDQ